MESHATLAQYSEFSSIVDQFSDEELIQRLSEYIYTSAELSPELPLLVEIYALLSQPNSGLTPNRESLVIEYNLSLAQVESFRWPRLAIALTSLSHDQLLAIRSPLMDMEMPVDHQQRSFLFSLRDCCDHVLRRVWGTVFSGRCVFFNQPTHPPEQQDVVTSEPSRFALQ